MKWWARNTENRPLFIGQSVMNTVQNADPKNPIAAYHEYVTLLVPLLKELDRDFPKGIN